MGSRLITNAIGHNTIDVTWTNIGCTVYMNTQTSVPFTLTTERSCISFMLSITGEQNFTISVKQTTGRVGRGIVTIAVTDSRNVNAMKMCFTESWSQSCSFTNMGSLSETRGIIVEINCKIIWLGFADDGKSPQYPFPPLSIENLPSDNTAIPDLTIIVEEQELSAHKIILAQHSPVLLAMFETPMKESKENKIIIEDLEFSTVKLLLQIIYTGASEDLNDIDTAFKVLEAAEKYQMPMMKSLCECKLQLRIQADNVLKLLEQADKYNAMKLCETCVAYIIAARNDTILCEFKKISQKPNISLAVMNAFMDQLFLTPMQK